MVVPLPNPHNTSKIVFTASFAEAKMVTKECGGSPLALLPLAEPCLARTLMKNGVMQLRY